MKKTSEWLFSYNSGYEKQVQALVSERKEIKDKPNQTSTTVSITGGKGGVGKTSISIKMAKELAAQGHKVLLLDCDYNLSNTAIKLGMPLTNVFYSLVSAEKPFEECIHKDGNFHLLPACNGNIGLFDSGLKLEEIIIDIITEHENEYDFILLDCPAGLMRETLVLNAYCDKRVVIVTPDRSSITDSYSLIKILSSRFGIKENHLLVNMVNNEKQYAKVVKTLSETVENFLGCRTQILGGIDKLNIDQGQFDNAFLSTGKSGHHNNFVKVVKKFTDELSTSSTGSEVFAFQPPRHLGHEVQLSNA